MSAPASSATQPSAAAVLRCARAPARPPGSRRCYSPRQREDHSNEGHHPQHARLPAHRLVRRQRLWPARARRSGASRRGPRPSAAGRAARSRGRCRLAARRAAAPSGGANHPTTRSSIPRASSGLLAEGRVAREALLLAAVGDPRVGAEVRKRGAQDQATWSRRSATLAASRQSLLAWRPLASGPALKPQEQRRERGGGEVEANDFLDAPQ